MYLSKTLAIFMTIISMSGFAQNSKTDTTDLNMAVNQYNIGENYFHGRTVAQNMSKAISFMEAAGENGYAKAQLNLVRIYLRGYKVKKNNSKAFYWAKKAAAQNISEAQYYLATLYLEGKGTKKNKQKGLQWLLKSKNQGYAKASEKWDTLENKYNS